MKTFNAIKLLAVLAIAFLFVELLSPLAFAQSLPPLQVQEKPLKPKASEASAPRKETISFASQAGAAVPCKVHEISAAHRQRLWDNTMGFTPNEINDLPLAEALGNQQGQFQNPMTQPWAPVVGQAPQDIRLIDLTLIGVDPAQAAKDLCKNDKKCLDKYLDKDGKVYAEATIPLSTAQQYAAMKGRASAANPVLAQLQKFGLYGGQVGVSLPSPSPLPYENLKVGVPGSNETRLSDLFKARAINPDACILDESIQGRVTYMALLDEDITYGTPSKEPLSGKFTSPATNKEDEELSDEDFHQAFTGSTILGYLMLNGGSNILIPSFYEEWLRTVNKINFWQFWLSLATGMLASSISKHIEKLAVSKNKYRQELLAREQNLANLRAWQGREIDTPIVNPDGTPIKGFTDAEGRPLTLRQSAANQMGDVWYELNEAEKALNAYEELKAPFDRVKSFAVPYLSASMALGFGWLGPARFLFEINAGLIMKAAGARNNQYVKVFVNKQVARSFRSASDPFGLGSASELLSKFTGLAVPSKAFEVRQVFLINYPSPIDVVTESRADITTIRNVKGTYAIDTKWFGYSYALNFEDVRGFGENDKYTTLPLVTNKILPETTVNKKVQGNVYKYITSLVLPVLISRGISTEIGRMFGVAAALKGFEIAMHVDENYGKGLECSAEELARIKRVYTNWLFYGSLGQLALSLSPVAIGAIAVMKKAEYLSWRMAFTTMSDIVNWVNPIIAIQLYLGNKAMTYVSNCVDSQYKILAYQALPASVKKKATGLQEKLSPIQDITEKLKLVVAAKESLQPSERPLDKMTEILNFKAKIDDQKGLVAPSEIYYLQIEQSVFSVKSSLWDLLAKKCRENYQDASKTATLGTDGVALYDKQGRLLAAFNDYAWRLRALARMRSQENARVILPNKFIETTLNCGEKPFVTIDTGGSALLKNDDCGATQCLRQKIKEVTGNEVKEDLSSVLGKISSVDTSEGIASFEGANIRFTRLLAAKGEKAGVQETVPSMEDYEKLVGTQLEGSQLDVLGNGQVVLNGPLGGTVKNQGVGVLKTIIGSRGKIEYNAADGTLLVFIYTLAEASAQGISSISASASNNALADGTQVPAVKLSTRDKTGVDTGVPEALDQIQKPGGMQSLETADHVYYFTQDAQGNPILRVIDKKTGAVTDYKITGPITRDAQGNLVIPTNKGPLTLGVGMQNGQPMLSAKGLGIDELLPLLVARGQNGILTFNPSTGAINVYNGQDIPLSPEFASKGIGFTGDERGNTRGIPQSNYFGPQRITGAAVPRAGLLALPSWPEDVALALLMVSLVLVGVTVIRRSEGKENEEENEVY